MQKQQLNKLQTKYTNAITMLNAVSDVLKEIATDLNQDEIGSGDAILGLHNVVKTLHDDFNGSRSIKQLWRGRQTNDKTTREYRRVAYKSMQAQERRLREYQRKLSSDTK